MTTQEFQQLKMDKLKSVIDSHRCFEGGAVLWKAWDMNSYLQASVPQMCTLELPLTLALLLKAGRSGDVGQWWHMLFNTF